MTLGFRVRGLRFKLEGLKFRVSGPVKTKVLMLEVPTSILKLAGQAACKFRLADGFGGVRQRPVNVLKAL